MGTLAIDIETASLVEEPPRGSNETEYFELLAVVVGFRAEDGSTDSTVLFREGGWEPEHTAALFERLEAWCSSRRIDRTLTYNGRWFDRRHLTAWARDLEETGALPGATALIERLFATHVDLALAARERHETELRPDQEILPLWLACELEGVEEERVRYEDHLPADYVDGLGVDAPFVTGAHVGRVLGERYVDGLVAGIEGTTVHRSLRRLLHDYAIGDVDVLFDLYDRLGGNKLDPGGPRPVDEGR